eukprot:CAMPEP_0178992170 /NCGR_PEP_ID=MMETSP0795-20121207/5954_1 /TAXON_ID=88552 /ORGANISM="Amoebophrya sp., Strain Ameob2" /LENGTH=223 /DNA_ID=CAMNT_0020683999 /DNA_START=56 /DNA_END=728 /DNA_ORIENTATION=-
MGIQLAAHAAIAGATETKTTEGAASFTGSGAIGALLGRRGESEPPAEAAPAKVVKPERPEAATALKCPVLAASAIAEYLVRETNIAEKNTAADIKEYLETTWATANPPDELLSDNGRGHKVYWLLDGADKVADERYREFKQKSDPLRLGYKAARDWLRKQSGGDAMQFDDGVEPEQVGKRKKGRKEFLTDFGKPVAEKVAEVVEMSKQGGLEGPDLRKQLSIH